MASLITIIFPQFLLILFGTSLRRFKPFSASFWSGLEALVFYVLFPPLLFNSVYKSKFNLEASAWFVCVAVSCMLGAVFLSWLVNQFYKESAWTKWSVFHCGFRFNTYIGFAICQPLLGNEGFALLSLLIAIWVPISNTIAVMTLSFATNSEPTFNAFNRLKAVAKNPLIIATVTGLLFNLLCIPLPQVINIFIGYLGSAALALGLLCIGAGLTFEDVKKYRNLIGWCTLERLVLVPCLAISLAFFLLPNPIEACVLILFAALPTAQSCYVMTSKMKGNGAAVADLTSSQTLLSMLTLPVWTLLMKNYFLS